MTTEYTPSDEDMESRYVLHSLSLFDFLPEERERCTKALGAEFRRGLARVRRDAARKSFEDFIANVQTMHDGTYLHAAKIIYAEVIRMAEVYAKANFPEETP